VPVHPDNRPLLGVMWKGVYYFDAMLPFGLRSAPKIFTAVADALEWCVHRRGVRGIDHYLDNFIIVENFFANGIIRTLSYQLCGLWHKIAESFWSAHPE